MANRFTLILGLVAAVIFGTVGLLKAGIIASNDEASPLAGRLMLAFSAVVLLVTLRQLLWPIPLVEVTARGIRLRIRGSTSRRGLLFVPWPHVAAVVLTQAATSHGGRENAIGFKIVDAEAIRLPVMKWNSTHAAPEAIACDVVFTASMVSGDVATAVQSIEGHRRRAVASTGEKVFER